MQSMGKLGCYLTWSEHVFRIAFQLLVYLFSLKFYEPLISVWVKKIGICLKILSSKHSFITF